MSKQLKLILRVLLIMAILPALQSYLHAQVDGNVYTYDAAGNHNYFVTNSNILVHKK